MECSPAADSMQTLRSPDFRERISAPVISSSLVLFAPSRRVPLSTKTVESERKPAALAPWGFRAGSLDLTCSLGERPDYRSRPSRHQAIHVCGPKPVRG